MSDCHKYTFLSGRNRVRHCYLQALSNRAIEIIYQKVNVYKQNYLECFVNYLFYGVNKMALPTVLSQFSQHLILQFFLSSNCTPNCLTYVWFSMNDILIIHIGAGKHDPNKLENYKTLLRNALTRPSITEASDVIESSSLTNTGYGSSLNLLGKVECDASYISNEKVGAIVNMTCEKPTKELFRIFQYLDTLYDSDETDLTPPVMLVYPLLKNLIPNIMDGNLVSAKSRKIYDTYKDKIFQGKHLDHYTIPNEVSDTIGITHISDTETTIVTSSGGNFFKLPGRIGCAGVIGAAIARKKLSDCEICCMCSGNGEQIIKSKLAWEIANSIANVAGDEYGGYLEKMIYELNPRFYVGFIIVLNYGSQTQLLYGHTTETFYFGFRSPNQTRIVLSSSDKLGYFTFGEYSLH